MKYISAFKTAFITSTMIAAAVTARAETIASGIASVTATNTLVSGSVDTAYITATFGTTDYIQDSTGGIEAYKLASSTQALYNLPIGTQINNLAIKSSTGTVGFELYASGTTPANQFEFTNDKSATTTQISSSIAGTPGSVPFSFYTLQTTAQVTSAASQGGTQSGTISQGIQNQLVYFNNVEIETGGAQATGTFTSGGTYQIVDSTGSVTLYINGASGLGGIAIPQGNIEVAGIDSEFSNAPEILPRGAFDFYAAGAMIPEPGTYLAGTLMFVAGAVGIRRRKA